MELETRECTLVLFCKLKLKKINFLHGIVKNYQNIQFKCYNLFIGRV